MSDQVDWKALIGQLILAKNEADKLDPDHLEPLVAPNTPAAPEDIAAFEDAAGGPLPEEYRQFLAHADGWRSFYFRAKLFGLADLNGQTPEAAVAADILDVYESEDVFEDLDVTRADVFPVCAGVGMRAMFVMIRHGRPDAGTVIWLDGEEVERYTGLAEFIATMRDYSLQQADKLRAGTAGS
ncbi:SMI1/KNR4 family protein [Longispora albida]|uniref:SMI1/KNR4 family protein n=1 Tax=Longispora albida TaxID=203523 RepID=UPI000376D908|nr:SMI1/KNR4 family protein [Longispora albida]